MKTVLAKNDSNKLVFLPRNFCLRNLIDIDYNNGFLVLNANVIKLATRVLKITSLQILAKYDNKDPGMPLEAKYYISATIYRDSFTA
jgi:hypothetical protein